MIIFLPELYRSFVRFRVLFSLGMILPSWKEMTLDSNALFNCLFSTFELIKCIAYTYGIHIIYFLWDE